MIPRWSSFELFRAGSASSGPLLPLSVLADPINGQNNRGSVTGIWINPDRFLEFRSRSGVGVKRVRCRRRRRAAPLSARLSSSEVDCLLLE
jgi:hypothetical protein